MPITVVCSKCSAKLNAPDAAAGKKVKCPKPGCGTVIPVPAPAAPEPEPVAEAEPEPEAASSAFADLGNNPPPKSTAKAKSKSAFKVEDEEEEKPKKKPRRDDPEPKPEPASSAFEDLGNDPPPKSTAKSKSKSKPAFKVEDEEEEQPKKKPRRSADEDEDEAPKKKSRRGDDDDEDDDQPRMKNKKPQKAGGLSPVALVGIILVGVLILGGIGYGIYAAFSGGSDSAGGGGGGGGGGGASLDGTYLLVGMEVNGTKMPEDAIAAMGPESERTFKIAGNKMIGTKNGKEDPVDVKFDSSKSPAQITMIATTGKKTKTSYGIYKLDGDTLTICMVTSSDKEADRPKEFKTSKGPKTSVIMTLKKAGAGGTSDLGTGSGGGGVDGTYVLEGMEMNGEKAPPAALKEMPESYEIAGNKFIGIKEGKADPNEVKFDSSKSPAQITMSETKDGETKTSYGIYKLEGDKLTICMAMTGQEADRPKVFKTSKGPKLMMMMIFKKK